LVSPTSQWRADTSTRTPRNHYGPPSTLKYNSPTCFLTKFVKERKSLLSLKSSPPNGTELRTANAVFNSALASSEPIASPTRRYAARVTQLLERQNAELVVIKEGLVEQRAILHQRKTHKKGQRVRLQGQFVYRFGGELSIRGGGTYHHPHYETW
jgi:hypothetical protein